ncbi:MAG: hypothetical protein ACRCWJ_16440 [Casimicrobium sp.]
MRTFTFALFLLVLSTVATAQQRTYNDADTHAEAVGIMKVFILTNRLMLRECSARFPDEKAQMSQKLLTWEEEEHMNIVKTENSWERMSKTDPKLAQMEKLIVSGFENMREPEATATLTRHCNTHFTELTSGIWRTRTPKTYRFLDEAMIPPPAPPKKR